MIGVLEWDEALRESDLPQFNILDLEEWIYLEERYMEFYLLQKDDLLNHFYLESPNHLRLVAVSRLQSLLVLKDPSLCHLVWDFKNSNIKKNTLNSPSKCK